MGGETECSELLSDSQRCMRIRTKILQIIHFEEWEDAGISERKGAVEQWRGKTDFKYFQVKRWKERGNELQKQV